MVELTDATSKTNLAKATPTLTLTLKRNQNPKVMDQRLSKNQESPRTKAEN